MAKVSIRDRLAKLEDNRRFLDWFVWARFFDSLTEDELETQALGGSLTDALPNRASRVGQVGPEESDHALERKRANPRGPNPRRAGLFHQERLLARAERSIPLLDARWEIVR